MLHNLENTTVCSTTSTVQLEHTSQCTFTCYYMAAQILHSNGINTSMKGLRTKDALNQLSIASLSESGSYRKWCELVLALSTQFIYTSS